MADLISRAEMLEALGHFNDYVNGDPHFLNGIETAKEITENLPTVEAVPVEWLEWRIEHAEREGFVEVARMLRKVRDWWNDQKDVWLVENEQEAG